MKRVYSDLTIKIQSTVPACVLKLIIDKHTERLVAQSTLPQEMSLKVSDDNIDGDPLTKAEQQELAALNVQDSHSSFGQSLCVLSTSCVCTLRVLLMSRCIIDVYNILKRLSPSDIVLQVDVGARSIFHALVDKHEHKADKQGLLFSVRSSWHCRHGCGGKGRESGLT